MWISHKEVAGNWMGHHQETPGIEDSGGSGKQETHWLTKWARKKTKLGAGMRDQKEIFSKTYLAG